MIDLEPSALEETLTILNRYAPHCEVWAFGSRAKGTAARYADLDLVLVTNEPLDPAAVEALRDAFSESDLPILVDLHDWRDLPETFRREIRKTATVLKTPA